MVVGPSEIPSVWKAVHLVVRLYGSVSVSESVRPTVRLAGGASVWECVCLGVRLSVCPSVSMSMWESVCLGVYLSVWESVRGIIDTTTSSESECFYAACVTEILACEGTPFDQCVIAYTYLSVHVHASM